MFDNNIFTKNTCRNLVIDGHVVGFELQTNVPYYRGIPLSMVNNVIVKENGAEHNRENIKCSIDQKTWFTLSEMSTVASYKWEFGEPLFIRVISERGLQAGTTNIELTVSVRTAYIPVPLVGVMSREVVAE